MAAKSRGGDGRVPPHNLDAEASLLGCALLSPDAAAGIPDPGQFYRPAHQYVADAIRTLVGGDVQVDVVTVAEELRRVGLLDDVGGLDELLGLQNATPAISGWRRYAAIVAHHWMLRKLIQTGSSISEIGYDEPVDVDQALANVRATLDTIEPGKSSLQVADMGAIFKAGLRLEKPSLLRRSDGACLFYLGKLHSIVAEGGTGKGWLALEAARQVLVDGGAVTYIDYEDTPESIAGRLITLGVDEQTVIERFDHVRPEGSLSAAKRRDLGKVLKASNPDLVIVDAWIGALTAEGYSEDSNEDVERWVDDVGRWLIRESGGAAVAILDHVVKDLESRGRWARGAGRKLDVIDGAIYALKTVTAFSVDTPGAANVVCNKDRPGNYTVGSVVAVAEIRPATGDHPMRVTLETKSAGAAARARSQWAPVETMQLVCDAVEDSVAPLTAAALAHLFPHVKPALLKEAIAHLLVAGNIAEARGGRGRAKTLRPLMPFHAPPEPGNGHHPEPPPPGLFDPEPYETTMTMMPSEAEDNVIRGPWRDPNYSPPDY